MYSNFFQKLFFDQEALTKINSETTKISKAFKNENNRIEIEE